MSFLKAAKDVFIRGPEFHLPERVVTNDDLVRWMGAEIRASWIEHRTGIRERRWAAKDEAVSDLAHAAAGKLLARHPSSRAEIRNLILATISGDFPTPPTSPLLQHRLGLAGCGAFDVGAACSGFVSALHVGASLVLATSEPQLVVAADIRSKFLNPSDFSTAVLFGDGAAAMLLDTRGGRASYRFIASQLFSDGSIADLISIPQGGSRAPFTKDSPADAATIRMKQPAAVFVKAVNGMSEAASTFLKKLDLRVSDVDWLVPHQANLQLIREIAKQMELAPERIVETVAFTGNTSGASVGIALAHLPEKKTKAGQKVLLLAAGGGGLAAAALLECLDGDGET